MKAKSRLKNTKAKPKKKVAPEPLKPHVNKRTDAQSGELLDPEQPLFYFGPPPALKALYKTNKGYDSAFHAPDMLMQLQNGHSPDEIAASWGISASTLTQWVEAYPELAEAKAVGATAFSAYWKRALRLTAFGQLKTVKENSLFKILDNQVGFNNNGGGHEFADTQGATLTFIDGDGKEL
jgi:hypothetical protein